MYKQKLENYDIGYVNTALDYRKLEELYMMFESKKNNRHIKYTNR